MRPAETEQGELRRLRIENRELREELDEWRRRDRDSVGEALQSGRVGAMQEWGDFSANEARMLLGLYDASPKMLSKQRLHDMRQFNANDAQIKLVDVVICKIRQKLRRRGFFSAIETAWGSGYYMPAHAKAAIAASFDPIEARP